MQMQPLSNIIIVSAKKYTMDTMNLVTRRGFRYKEVDSNIRTTVANSYLRTTNVSHRQHSVWLLSNDPPLSPTNQPHPNHKVTWRLAVEFVV